MNAYPYSAEDQYNQKLEIFTVLGRELQENCFNACAKPNDLTFLTIQEGMCLRNCITKFSLWYNTFGDASADAAYWKNKQLLDEGVSQGGDPWKGKEKLL